MRIYTSISDFSRKVRFISLRPGPEGAEGAKGALDFARYIYRGAPAATARDWSASCGVP